VLTLINTFLINLQKLTFINCYVPSYPPNFAKIAVHKIMKSANFNNR